MQIALNSKLLEGNSERHLRENFHTIQFFSSIIVTLDDISVRERRFETVKKWWNFFCRKLSFLHSWWAPSVQKLIWTIIFCVDFEIGAFLRRKKIVLNVPPARLLQNLISKPTQTARRLIWTIIFWIDFEIRGISEKEKVWSGCLATFLYRKIEFRSERTKKWSRACFSEFPIRIERGRTGNALHLHFDVKIQGFNANWEFLKNLSFQGSSSQSTTLCVTLVHFFFFKMHSLSSKRQISSVRFGSSKFFCGEKIMFDRTTLHFRFDFFFCLSHRKMVRKHSRPEICQRPSGSFAVVFDRTLWETLLILLLSSSKSLSFKRWILCVLLGLRNFFCRRNHVRHERSRFQVQASALAAPPSSLLGGEGAQALSFSVSIPRFWQLMIVLKMRFELELESWNQSEIKRPSRLQRTQA